jgi:hypothetical protein
MNESTLSDNVQRGETGQFAACLDVQQIMSE